jgi:hypothetical protein
MGGLERDPYVVLEERMDRVRASLDTSVERTGGENASTRIHLGVSALSALNISACAHMSMGRMALA